MNYIIILILILITGLGIYISYVYNNIYIKLFAGSILLILGLSLFFGIDYPTGNSNIDTYNLTEIVEENQTITTGSITQTTINNYTNFNDYITKAIALILVLGGFLIFIFQPIEQKPVIL